MEQYMWKEERTTAVIIEMAKLMQTHAQGVNY